MNPKPSNSLSAAGLVLLCIIAYVPLWNNDFIDLDDEKYITTNNQVRGGLTAEGIAWAWSTYHAGFWFPLTWMSLQFDATLSRCFGDNSGLSPAVFHAQNLFWHTAATVLLFVVLARMTSRVWPSAMAAALFAVHPMHVESVAWATERKDVLSAFFWMLTLYSYVRYTEKPSGRRYMYALLSFLMGLLAKPMLVTLPFVLLLLDYWPLRRYGKQNAGELDSAHATSPRTVLRRIVLEKIPLLALAVGAALLAVMTQVGEGAAIPLAVLPVTSRFANATTSYAWYLEKTFWPSDLSLFYLHPMNDWTWPPVLVSTALLVLISVSSVATVRRAPWFLIGWLWFLGTLAPVIGLVQVGAQARADRFVYIPHVGLFIAIVWSAMALLERLKIRHAARGVWAGAFLLGLTVTTLIQVCYWQDTESIWTRVLAVTSNNHRAHASLGRFYMQKFRETGDRDDFDKALPHLREAARIAPGIAEYEYNLGVNLLMRGDLDAAGAQFRDALRDSHGSATGDFKRPDALHNLGLVESRRKNYSEAERIFRAALRESPQADTQAELGCVLWDMGRRSEAKAQWESALAANGNLFEALEGMGHLHLQQGNDAEATRFFETAASIKPNRMQTWSDLGIAYGRLQRWDQAVAAHDQALKLAVTVLSPGPEFSVYVRRLAYALRSVDRTDEAERLYAECSTMDPSWRATNLTSAWNLATAAELTRGDAATAFELSNEACQGVEAPSARDLDIEAAALAALGRFDEAVAVCRKAIALSDQTGPIAERLTLYKQKKRYVRK